jgi:hypothetical protein
MVLLGRVAQAAVGGLLQGGGDVGRGGRAGALLLGDLGHREGPLAGFVLHGLGGLGVADLGLLSADLGQIGHEGGRLGPGQGGAQHPVFLGHEGQALLLAVHDELEGHGLHAPGGDAALDLLPQQRRDLVAHQPVEHAPGLLGVEEVLVQLTGVLQGLAHGPRGDLVELDAAYGLALVLDELGHVPGDGLALAVGVRREVDVVGLGRGAGQPLHDLFLAADDAVFGLEGVLVHAKGLGRQVAHVAHGGLHA